MGVYPRGRGGGGLISGVKNVPKQADTKRYFIFLQDQILNTILNWNITKRDQTLISVLLHKVN